MYKNNERHVQQSTCHIFTTNFRLYAKGTEGLDYVVNGWKTRHTCSGRQYRQKTSFGSEWVASMIEEKVNFNQNYTPKQIAIDMRLQYGANISYRIAWSAREKCKSKINGCSLMSYAMLPDYLEELKNSNDGSNIIYESRNGHFLRWFISFRACITSFMFCRPIVCLDACHLKGQYKGQLFAATCLDGNN